MLSAVGAGVWSRVSSEESVPVLTALQATLRKPLEFENPQEKSVRRDALN